MDLRTLTNRQLLELIKLKAKELEYEEGSALRKMNEASVLKDIPEVEQKIGDGSLTLSNICQAHTYFRKEEKLKS